ncbi:3'-5' exonuclease [Marinicrinis lubricantis]|uniref:3'-5' exonuclease n=1 Tax=Marinicrinis lubricantis TaxID=2086470 RepID=A0ABW1ISV0_9BACL
MNYRNTAQIAQFAWNFYRSNSELKDKVKEGSVEGVEIIPPQATKRKGPEPIIKRCNSFKEEMEFISQHIKELVTEKKLSYSDVAILYRVKKNYHTSYIDIIMKQLAIAKIPFYWITENTTSKREYDKTENSVKVSTIDSAKGLDFRVVFIVNIENLPFHREENEEREVSLFYIGMTRALEWLFLTYSGESKFTKYLDQVNKQKQMHQTRKTQLRGS